MYRHVSTDSQDHRCKTLRRHGLQVERIPRRCLTRSRAAMAQTQLPAKVHKAAVAIIPPLHLTHAIQRIRCFKDKSFVRWPPHINLVYPFIEDKGDGFEVAAQTAAVAVAAIKPFKLSLSTLSFFDHGRSHTMWLKPEDATGVLAIQSALESAFPGCNDLSNDPSRGITTFTPHLSLGQWPGKQQLMADMQAYEQQGVSLEFEVQEVCLISRQGFQDPFTIRYAVPLGSAIQPPVAPYPKPQLINAPYIATTATNLHTLLPPQNPTDKLRFGLGAAENGVWNFAYGANMSPRKLGGSRNLNPMESRPGVLRGYELRFNHRGGFGNLVEVDGAGDGCKETQMQGNCAAAAEGGGAAVPTAAAGSGADTPAAVEADSAKPAAAAAVAAGEVHGVLHRLSAADLATLMCMEHEYWPVEVAVKPYPQQQQQQQRLELNAPQQASTSAAKSASGPFGTAPVQNAGANSQPHRDLQQQQQIVAVAFVSPPERCIQDGLPPIKRYLDHLTEGAQHWQLDPQYTSWLTHQPSIAAEQRGDEYYTSAIDGQPLKAWPKIRTGGQQQRQQQRGRGGYGRGKRSRQPKEAYAG